MLKKLSKITDLTKLNYCNFYPVPEKLYILPDCFHRKMLGAAAPSHASYAYKWQLLIGPKPKIP